MSQDKKSPYFKEVANNKKAFFDYFVEEKLEAGLALAGSEVKAIRLGHASLKESYARVVGNELWLMGCHILPYSFGKGFTPPATRDRKLLVHARELKKWAEASERKGMTIVPLRMYLKGSKVKVELGLCRAKKQFDKRASIKDKELKRELSRSSK